MVIDRASEAEILNISKLSWDAQRMGQIATVSQVRIQFSLKDRGILSKAYNCRLYHL